MSEKYISPAERPAYDPELAQRRFQANLRRRGKPQQAGT